MVFGQSLMQDCHTRPLHWGGEDVWSQAKMTTTPIAPLVHRYAGPYLNRYSEQRKDAAWIESLSRGPMARFVPVWNQQSLIIESANPRAALLESSQAGSWLANSETIYLGQFDEHHCFAVELPQEITPDPGHSFVDVRQVGGLMHPSEAGLLAYARALIYWRARHRYCGGCGHATKSDSGGQVRICLSTACGIQAFPRLDPAIIVLVTLDDKALLGRQSSWPAHRYSTLAGFVEPGESLEDAVIREVAEEAHVEVVALRYHSSQPWPFPSSLMVGFRGLAAPGSQPRAGEELEDARFVTRDELINGSLKLPPSVSISFHLIKEWYEEQPGRDLVADLARQGHPASW